MLFGSDSFLQSLVLSQEEFYYVCILYVEYKEIIERKIRSHLPRRYVWASSLSTLVSSLSTLVERGGVLSPLPLPTPSSLATCPPPPKLSPSRVKYELGRNMGGEDSAPGGSRLRDATCLTATPSAAGRTPPPTCSVTSRLLDLYRDCMDSGSWARVLYDACGGLEKLIFIRKIEPVSAPAAAAPPHKNGRPASARRRAHDKRRREAWAERRRNRSQTRSHTSLTEDNNTHTIASADVSITPAATSPSTQVLPSQPASPPPIVSPPPIWSPHRSCHHSRHPCRGKGSRHLVKLRAPAVVLRFCL
jgi:hypothetical protein